MAFDLFTIAPIILPPTIFIDFFTSFKSDIFVFPEFVTITDESTIVDNTILSETNLHGGASIIIISYILFNIASNSFILLDANNSDGFGGIVPFVNICKLGILVSFMYSFAKYTSFSTSLFILNK